VLFRKMPTPVAVAVPWLVVVVVVQAAAEVIRLVMLLLAEIRDLLMAEPSQTGTCSLKMLEVVFRLMVLLDIVLLVMGMVPPTTAWVMAVTVVMVLPILGMEALLLQLMETLMHLVLVMEVVHRVLLEVLGAPRLPQGMVPAAMGMPLLGVVVQPVGLVLHPQVNLRVGLLGMEAKVMCMVGMVDRTGLMQIKLLMVLLVVVLEVSPIVMLLPVGGRCKAVVVPIGEVVATEMPMGLRDMEIKDGMILLQLLEVMELRQMGLMVAQLDMVVGMAVPRLDRLNSSDFDDLIVSWTRGLFLL